MQHTALIERWRGRSVAALAAHVLPRAPRRMSLRLRSAAGGRVPLSPLCSVSVTALRHLLRNGVGRCCPQSLGHGSAALVVPDTGNLVKNPFHVVADREAGAVTLGLVQRLSVAIRLVRR